ncbi:unnamed protein product, partial [Prorocentrum cordatum]
MAASPRDSSDSAGDGGSAAAESGADARVEGAAASAARGLRLKSRRRETPLPSLCSRPWTQAHLVLVALVGLPQMAASARRAVRETLSKGVKTPGASTLLRPHQQPMLPPQSWHLLLVKVAVCLRVSFWLALAL